MNRCPSRPGGFALGSKTYLILVDGAIPECSGGLNSGIDVTTDIEEIFRVDPLIMLPSVDGERRVSFLREAPAKGAVWRESVVAMNHDNQRCVGGLLAAGLPLARRQAETHRLP